MQFTALQGDQEVTFTFELHDGKPKKLGDGSFGSVFAVIGPGGDRKAVKIFYRTDDPTVLARYEHEMDCKVRLQDELAKRGLLDLRAHLVLPDAKTEVFLKSPAAEELKPYFADSGLSVSNYALVMDRYTCTLKDILERGAPEGRLIGITSAPRRGTPGYEILRRLDVAEREAVILPLVHQISRGLLALHAAHLHHHDLKPANILVRVAGGQLQVALADFGFLLPNQYADTLRSRHGEALPLGTRHYRSPEQKDYFDVCEVDVATKSEGKRELYLTTFDRKFRDTIIEKGDTAVFSKDPSRRPFEIVNIVNDADTDASTIYLRADGDIGVAKDERTQVVFYKKHTIRTDLFGLGAILFDMLTCGNSAERFYDYLRPYDRPKTKDDQDEINDLMARYKAIRNNAPAATPGFAALFEQLLVKTFSFPREDVVGIILRSMLSEPRDSYFASVDTQSPLEVFGQVSTDLQRALDIRGGGQYAHDANPLWRGEENEERFDPKEEPFKQRVVALQELDDGQLALRFAFGYRMLRRIADAANTVYRDDNTYLAVLSPDNLVFGNDVVRVILPTYATEAHYYRALMAGDALGIAGGLDPDNFVPPSLRMLARYGIASVSKNRAPDNGESGEVTAALRYLDSIPFWQGLSRGDFIRFDLATGSRALCEVVGAEKYTVRFRPTTESDGLKLAALTHERVLAIKKLSALDYYLSMVGVYIHQLFFVDNARDCGALPDLIWQRLQEQAAGVARPLLSRRLSAPPRKIAKMNVEERARQILDELATLYYWLVLAEGAICPGIDSRKRDFAVLLQALDMLRDTISQSLGGVTASELDALSDRELRERKWSFTYRRRDLATLDETLHRLCKCD
jgi:serine/threonine protein kinase